jgi:hypothetical protein
MDKTVAGPSGAPVGESSSARVRCSGDTTANEATASKSAWVTPQIHANVDDAETMAGDNNRSRGANVHTTSTDSTCSKSCVPKSRAHRRRGPFN